MAARAFATFLPVGFELRLLRGREDGHDFIAHLFARLRIAGAAPGMRLTILLADLIDLCLLLLRQVEIFQEMGAAMALRSRLLLTLRGRRLNLREADGRDRKSGCQGGRNKQ